MPTYAKQWSLDLSTLSRQSALGTVGEASTFNLTQSGATTNVTGWTLKATLSKTLGESPVKSWTDASFSNKTSGGAFTLSTAAADTQTLASRAWLLEIRRVDSGAETVLSRVWWTLNDSASFDEVPVASLTVLSLARGGTEANLSGTGPGVVTQTSIGGALSITPYVSLPTLSGAVPTSRTLTINGTTYDLSANRSWTITTFSGAFGDLTGTPTTLAGYGITDAATSSALSSHTGNTSNPHNVTASQVGLGNVDNTSDANKPISTATQAALDGKAASSHSHAQSDVTGLTTALAGKEPTITAGTTNDYFRGDKTFQTLNKSAVGLGNVDNTSDANKPVSTATQTALDAKQPLDATLTALAALDSTAGILVQSGADAFARRTLTAGTGISITNGTGASGNPTVAIGTTVVTTTGTQSLTNKTISDPKIGIGMQTSGAVPWLLIERDDPGVDESQGRAWLQWRPSSGVMGYGAAFISGYGSNFIGLPGATLAAIDLEGTGPTSALAFSVSSSNAVVPSVPVLASDPTGGTIGNGCIYYNSATNKFKGRAGGSWVDLH